MMCGEKNVIFFFLFCKKNVPLRYYKRTKNQFYDTKLSISYSYRSGGELG